MNNGEGENLNLIFYKVLRKVSIYFILSCILFYSIYFIQPFFHNDNNFIIAEVEDMYFDELQFNEFDTTDYDTYMVQSLDILNCGNVLCNKSSFQENNAIFNYTISQNSINTLAVEFTIDYKTENLEPIYILGILNDEIIQFCDNSSKSYLKVETKTQNGSINLRINLNLKNSVNYANLSLIAVTESESKEIGSVLNFISANVVEKSLVDSIITDSFNQLTNAYNLKPNKITESSEDNSGYSFLNKSNDIVFNLNEAFKFESSNNIGVQEVEVLFLDKDFNQQNNKFNFGHLKEDRSSIYNIKVKDKKIKYAIINENPNLLNLKSKYNYVKGYSKMPPSTFLIIGE